MAGPPVRQRLTGTPLPAPRILAILGSGETAPAMTSVHAHLLSVLPAEATAVMLDTPYGFQENATEISQRSANYFRHNVGHPIEVLTFRHAASAAPIEYERMAAALAVASYVFAGPGSPSYALRQWRGTRVPALLREKLVSGGIVVFASAAAVGLGEVALPVYEVYKAGHPIEWIPGLDLLAVTGIRAAVIPHYNNAEGGTHDTRFCYMGERRLRLLEDMLPEGCAVLGVDEHTACIIDVDAGTLEVRGAGRVTWRVAGHQTAWAAGVTVAVEALNRPGGRAQSPHSDRKAPTPGTPLPVRQLRAEALLALEGRDLDAAVSAILAVESASHRPAEAGAGDEREALRELVMHLAGLARTGAIDPRERLAPLVEALLSLRQQARADGRFSDADSLRAALGAGGVEVRDTPGGASWDLRGAPG